MLYSDINNGSPSERILINIFMACSRNAGYCGEATIACKEEQIGRCKSGAYIQREMHDSYK